MLRFQPVRPIPLLLISRIELTFNWIIAITLHSSRLNCARLSLSHKPCVVAAEQRESENPRNQWEDEGARDKTSLNTFYEIKTLIACNNFLTDTSHTLRARDREWETYPGSAATKTLERYYLLNHVFFSFSLLRARCHSFILLLSFVCVVSSREWC